MKKLFIFILMFTLLVSCTSDNTESNPNANHIETTSTTVNIPEPTTSSLAPVTHNLNNECVTDYNPNVDYFPHKIDFTYAEGIKVEYFNHYKVLHVTNPWMDATKTFEYVLVQCGTPIPTDYDTAQIVEVPIKTMIAMSTTYIPHLDALDELDGLVGLDSLLYVSNEKVGEMIDAGKLAEIGTGATVNVEVVLDLEPDLIMTQGIGNPEWDAHPVLMNAGLSVALNSEHMETSPLGRAEWIKFTAAFYNKEETANMAFEQMVTTYNNLKALTENIETYPTVFANAPWGGTWAMAGGKSFTAQLFADAGANYLWADDENAGSIFLDFESVYDVAAEADYWLNPGGFSTQAEMLATDERYGEFLAFQTGNMWNHNARVNENGGDDYWETGLTNPHLILADLIYILHPELLPDHELYFYQQVSAE